MLDILRVLGSAYVFWYSNAGCSHRCLSTLLMMGGCMIADWDLCCLWAAGSLVRPAYACGRNCLCDLSLSPAFCNLSSASAAPFRLAVIPAYCVRRAALVLLLRCDGTGVDMLMPTNFCCYCCCHACTTSHTHCIERSISRVT